MARMVKAALATTMPIKNGDAYGARAGDDGGDDNDDGDGNDDDGNNGDGVGVADDGDGGGGENAA
eukprot:7975392-Lingulodinium_polyedra.AAC.1